MSDKPKPAEPLPCRFCGKKSAVVQKNRLIGMPFSISCGNDKCKAPSSTKQFVYEAEAIAAWNTRAK